MKRRKEITKDDCRSSKRVLSFAKTNDVDVRECAGSHFIMRKGSDVITGYHGEISEGVAGKIFKFFVKVGLVGGWGLGVLYWMYLTFS